MAGEYKATTSPTGGAVIASVHGREPRREESLDANKHKVGTSTAPRPNKLALDRPRHVSPVVVKTAMDSFCDRVLQNTFVPRSSTYCWGIFSTIPASLGALELALNLLNIARSQS